MQPLKEREMRMICGGDIISDLHTQEDTGFEYAHGRRAGTLISEYYAIINSWMRGLVVTS